MARPTPNAIFMMDLAKTAQVKLKKEFPKAALIAADPGVNFALMVSPDEQDILVLDRKQEKIVRKLKLPRGARRAVDYGHFTFNDGGTVVGAYDSLTKCFTVWSLADGTQMHHGKGEGTINPAIAFMPGGRVSFCDGPRVNTYMLGGDLLFYTPVSDDMRSVVLFAPPSPRPTVVVVGAFRKGLGGHTLHVFQIENGIIQNRSEGPYRARPDNPNDQKSIELYEFLNIPGSTERILILSEEEKFEKRAPGSDSEWEFDEEFKTRLLAVDPARGRFYPDEITIEGRHCLEMKGAELHLMDEMGRRRRIAGFPLRLEHIDWRLTE